MLPSGVFRLALTMLVVIQHFSRLSLALGAICLLFTISGFWLCKAWVERYSLCDKPYRTYLVSRMWRILPVFWVCNVLGYLVVGVNFTNWVDMIPNSVVIGHSYLAHPALLPAWPLDIIVQFSLAAPLLCYLMAVSPVVTGSAAMAIGALGLVTLLVWGGSGHVGIQRLNLLHFLVFFLAGMLVYLKPAWRPGARAASLSALATVVAICVALLQPDLRSALFGGPLSGPEFLFRNHLLNVALAGLALPFAMNGLFSDSSPLDRAAGDLSYIIYLIHWPICVLTNQHYASLPAVDRLPYVGGAIILTIGLSVMLLPVWSRLAEQPRRAFVARRLAAGRSGARVHGLASAGLS